MGDQLTPINKHSPEQGTLVNKDTKQSIQPTYQKQLPNCVPTHDCDEIPWYKAGSGQDMSLEHQKIMGNRGVRSPDM